LVDVCYSPSFNLAVGSTWDGYLVCNNISFSKKETNRQTDVIAVKQQSSLQGGETNRCHSPTLSPSLMKSWNLQSTPGPVIYCHQFKYASRLAILQHIVLRCQKERKNEYTTTTSPKTTIPQVVSTKEMLLFNRISQKSCDT